MPPITIAQARRAKIELKKLVGDDENVVGVGLTKDESGYAIKVNCKSEPKRSRVPSSVEGVPVVSEVVGTIRARPPRRRTAT